MTIVLILIKLVKFFRLTSVLAPLTVWVGEGDGHEDAQEEEDGAEGYDKEAFPLGVPALKRAVHHGTATRRRTPLPMQNGWTNHFYSCLHLKL